jgi:hypothetical protein
MPHADEVPAVILGIFLRSRSVVDSDGRAEGVERDAVDEELAVAAAERAHAGGAVHPPLGDVVQLRR